VKTKLTHASTIVLVALVASLTAGCGEFIRQDRAPTVVVVNALEASSGADPGTFGGTLNSDVITVVTRDVNGQQVSVPTVFNDSGRVTMSLVLKDPGIPGAAQAPSAINQVTINRYRVTYRRADGRNTPGVDVPFPFDSALTVTVPPTGTVQAGFEIVRHVAKEEAPLRALAVSEVLITTIAQVEFFGRDQAGHDIMATANIGITFGNFGDPE
jgi:hypothetical protein